MNPVEAILAGPVTPDAVSRWAASARTTASLVRTIAPNTDHVTPIVDAAVRGPVTLAVGGHFKTGKSTLLNAALGRRLLPEDDLPETGALCVLTAAAMDSATVIDVKGRKRAIACTTDAIRSEVGLIDGQGSRRTPDAVVNRLQIDLVNVSIPSGAAWIDTPGINDTPAMDARAWVGVERAEVLIWVVGSRQPLAESEVRFLSRRVATAGPQSVVFVVNAFLNEDTAKEWQAFLQEGKWARIQTKLSDAAAEIGLAKGPLPVLPIAARAAAKAAAAGRPGEFGGGAVRSLLSKLSTPSTPRVLAGRLSRAAFKLDELARDCRSQATSLRNSFNTAMTIHGKNETAVEELRESLARAVKGVVAEAVEAVESAASEYAEQVAGIIDASNLNREGHYETVFANALDSFADDLAERLISAVADMCKGTSVKPPRSSLRKRVASLLTPPRQSIVVPQSATAADKPVGGALLGGIAGFMLGGPIGAAIGAGLGGAGGGSAAAAKAREQDAAAARASARNAGRLAASHASRQSGALERLILANCEMPDVGTPPDGNLVVQWEAAAKALETLTRTARTTAGMP